MKSDSWFYFMWNWNWNWNWIYLFIYLFVTITGGSSRITQQWLKPMTLVCIRGKPTCALCAKTRQQSSLKKKKTSCIKIYIKRRHWWELGTIDTRSTRQIKAREHMSPKNMTITTPAITYSKGRRDEMILSIHPSRRPSVHPSSPSVPSWSVDSDGAEKTVEWWAKQIGSFKRRENVMTALMN